MKPRDAYYILFVHDYGKGPLFKSQVDLVYEFLNTEGSAYYLNRDETETEKYSKEVNRLKAYLSQLFSEASKRFITPDFRDSLKKVLNKKTAEQSFDSHVVLENILLDLREKNLAPRYTPDNSTLPSDSYRDFFQSFLNASHISVFTAREITFDLNISEKKISVIEFLIDDFISSFKSHIGIKRYSFNFPLHQSCCLFWRALRKEIVRYLKLNRHFLPSVLPLLTDVYNANSIVPLLKNEINIADKQIGSDIVPSLLLYLSAESIVSVYHLPAPVYLTSSVVMNPNDPKARDTYLLLKSPKGEDLPHKLTNEEVTMWKFFVWEKIKMDNEGIPIPYSSLY